MFIQLNASSSISRGVTDLILQSLDIRSGSENRSHPGVEFHEVHEVHEGLRLQLLRLDSSWASALEAVHNDGNDLEQLEHLQGDRRGALECIGVERLAV